jgi:hypothetical protein
MCCYLASLLLLVNCRCKYASAKENEIENEKRNLLVSAIHFPYRIVFLI